MMILIIPVAMAVGVGLASALDRLMDRTSQTTTIRR